MRRAGLHGVAGHGAALMAGLILWACLSAAPPAEAQEPPAVSPEVAAAAERRPEPNQLQQWMDAVFGRINGVLAKVLFFSITGDLIKVGEVDAAGEPVVDPATGEPKVRVVPVPLIVLVLLFGGIFFTFWFKWINVRGFKHAIDVTRGRYDDPKDTGEVSHFRALTSALSATVGLGNIAGVAIAIQLGGPGAVFWMWLGGLFGMTSKFNECTLAQMYRRVNPDGSISGGPMFYLDLGLRQKGGGWRPLGKLLAVFYAFMIMGGAVGGGNMFQSNQSWEAIHLTFNISANAGWIYGLLMAFLVALVVVGGIRRIGAATSRIVPFMCGLYVLTSIYVIVIHWRDVPATFGLIFRMALTDNAFYGGLFGVMVMGIRRATFSNEAGLGSAAIAHAAAKTEEPVREGIVALLEPFIDTIVVCTMTGLVVIITGVWDDQVLVAEGADIGATITTEAFRSVLPVFPYILAACIFLFAYSTMISWCYYGERGWIYLLDHLGGRGLRTVIVFRLIFVSFVFIGAVTKLSAVLDFSDMVILCLAFPNIIGGLILAPVTLRKVQDYWDRYASGRMIPWR